MWHRERSSPRRGALARHAWPSIAAVALASVHSGAPAAAHARRDRAPHTVEVTLTAAPARLALLPGTRRTSRVQRTGAGSDARAARGRPRHRSLPQRLREPTHDPLARAAHPCRSGRQPVPSGRRRAARTTTRSPSARAARARTGTTRIPTTGPGIRSRRASYGAIIVRAADDPLPAIARRAADRARRTTASAPDGAIDLPDPTRRRRRRRGERPRRRRAVRERRVMPTITIRSGEVQRWRIDQRVGGARLPARDSRADAAARRQRRRAVRASRRSEGDRRSRIGERVELLVRGTGAPGHARDAADAAVRSLRAADAAGRLERRARPAHAAVHRRTARRRPATARDAARGSSARHDAARRPARHGAHAGHHQRPLDGHGARGRRRPRRRHGDLAGREPRRHGPPVPPARIPVPGARSRRGAGAVPQLEGRRERAEARDRALRRAVRRLPRQMDVPLPHPRSRGSRDDGRSRSHT